MIDISGSTADGCLSLSGEETLGYAGRRCRHRLIGPATRCYSLIHRLPLKLHSLRSMTIHFNELYTHRIIIIIDIPDYKRRWWPGDPRSLWGLCGVRFRVRASRWACPSPSADRWEPQPPECCCDACSTTAGRVWPSLCASCIAPPCRACHSPSDAEIPWSCAANHLHNNVNKWLNNNFLVFF